MAYKKREKRGFSARRKSGRASRHTRRDTSPEVHNLPTMTCGEDVTMESLLTALFQYKSPADVKEIAQAIGLPPHCLQDLDTALRSLRHRHLLAAHGKKKYLLNGEIVKEGTLSVHPRGFGFAALAADETTGKKQDDIFIPERNMAGALHGDRILLGLQRLSSRRNRLEGAVLAILERTAEQIVGFYAEGSKRGIVTPEDARFPFQIIIPLEFSGGAQNGAAVVVQLDPAGKEKKPPEPFQKPALVGKIIEVLGNPEELAVQMEMVIRKHGLPRTFTPVAIHEAEALTIPTTVSADRTDLRDILHVTIDGETARDFDDAVSIVKTKNGYKLYVSIADVSHYVKPGSPLDQEAYLRGTSVYFPTGVVPMLPEQLSNEICSLKPDENRYSFTCILDFDRNGKRQKTEFCKSIIKSQYRLTYTLVSQILVDKDTAVRSQYKPLLTPLKWMGELAAQLEQLRLKRGSIGLEIPEAIIDLNTEENTILSIRRSDRNQAHKIVEEFMLAANEAVAATFVKHRHPAIFRIHENPDTMKAMELSRLLHSLGFHSREDAGSIQWFDQVLKTARGTPQEYIVNNLILRVMQQARYSTDNIGHFGLAADSYTHFTSPIRRYPDLLVHRALARLLHLDKEKVQTQEASSLSEAADFLSDRERIAVKAERDMLDRLKVFYMEDKVGEVFEGIISGVSAFGLFIELRESLISGAVSLTDMSGDSFFVDEENHRILGRSSRTSYQLGDLVQVRLLSADKQRWRLNFTLE
ncbi:MAG: ribonuclease R [Desulfobulbaceae bacterium]|uniref:Ribonuclease R n=1 Tax=Candidatus Desulfobia pelagia TaxID=2841692 RepID=A0A8J6NDV7_9BACT|nr:ribonuclease R [Candidatus Desulfobia pelagia]